MHFTKSRYLPAGFNVRHISTRKKKGAERFALNILAFLIVISMFILLAWGINEMSLPISNLIHDPIDLSPYSLCEYSLRTVLRMVIAVIFSLIFTLIYATLAAKNHYAEQILIPLLDVLQSVPILGYISFTVTGFLALFPGNIMGAECAAIFAIFTSQVWNMTFSFYQSLKTVPQELQEAAYIFKMSGWQRFWRVELLYGVPGLIWNTVLSMSGSWFFVVASEVITVGNNKIVLPGIGSYIALAITEKNTAAIFYAIIAMVVIILLYNQLLINPLVAWSDKFRYEMSSNQNCSKSWVFSLFQKKVFIKKLFLPVSYIANYVLYLPILNKQAEVKKAQERRMSVWSDLFWYILLFSLGLIASYYLFNFLHKVIGWGEVVSVFILASITLLRIVVLIIIASLIWVPIGIYIGLNPKLSERVQPLAQFLAAFPANLLFPIMVLFITHYNLNPNIWLSPLMIMGTQWYILFNVIAGSNAFPNDLREATQNLNIKGRIWWTKVMLPAVTPYFLTGVVTAVGGAWNVSIVAEVVNFGDKQLIATGLGSYIAEMTVKADFPRIVLGVGVMSLFVVVLNRLIWQPLLDFCNNKFQL